MKKILVALIVLALIGAAVGYYKYDQRVEKSLEHNKPDVVLSADQLIQDYEQDEKKADEKYLGKVLEVSGKVTEITKEEGKKKVHLEALNSISTVVFDFDESISIGNMKAGDNVRLKGKCTGYLGDVILNQSSVVQ